MTTATQAQQDPATPTHIDEPDTVLEGDERPEGTDLAGQPLKKEDQGGDPTGDPTPEKEEASTPDEAPASIDLSDENQQVAEAVAEAGLKPADLRAAMEKNGGIVPLAALKALVAKHGEGVANATAEQLKGMYTAGVAAAEAANTKAYASFEGKFEGAEEGSGKQHFENAAAWARENLPEGERKGITDMINSSNEYVSNLGLSNLAAAYQGSDQYSQAGDLLSGDNLVTADVTVVDKATYQRELSALMKKGYGYDSREVTSLRNRRTAALSRGQ